MTPRQTRPVRRFRRAHPYLYIPSILEPDRLLPVVRRDIQYPCRGTLLGLDTGFCRAGPHSPAPFLRAVEGLDRCRRRRRSLGKVFPGSFRRPRARTFFPALPRAEIAIWRDRVGLICLRRKRLAHQILARGADVCAAPLSFTFFDMAFCPFSKFGKGIVLLAFVNIAMVYTHYFGWLVIICELTAIALINRERLLKTGLMTAGVFRRFCPVDNIDHEGRPRRREIRPEYRLDAAPRPDHALPV